MSEDGAGGYFISLVIVKSYFSYGQIALFFEGFEIMEDF